MQRTKIGFPAGVTGDTDRSLYWNGVSLITLLKGGKLNHTQGRCPAEVRAEAEVMLYKQWNPQRLSARLPETREQPESGSPS